MIPFSVSHSERRLPQRRIPDPDKFRDVTKLANAGAIILAGGRSSRMGRPKSQLDFGGVTLLERLVDALSSRFAELVIVAAPQSAAHSRIDLPGVRIVRDEVAFAGPLDALRRGLESLSCEAAFACSCDLPLLDVNVAAALVAMLDGFDAVIPEVAGRLQPLHAVYHRRCAEALAALAARGESRLGAIADAVNALRVDESAMRAIDPKLRSFFNLNTPADYARALQML